MPLDSLYRYVLALDDAQWEEKKHHRDKGGQFSSTSGATAKKSEVSNSLSWPLGKHGFKLKPGGEAAYTHSSGHEIHVKAPGEGQKLSLSWHDPKSGKSGIGRKSLVTHLSSLGISSSTTIKAPKAGKPPPDFQHPAAAYAKTIGEHGGVPVKETETSQTYKFPNGTMLAIKKKPPKSAWGLSYVKWAMTTPSGELIKYKGVGALQNTLAKHEGAVVPQTNAPTISQKLEIAGLVKEPGTKQAGGESYANYYQKHDAEGKLQESVAFKDNGNFRLWSAGTKLAEKYPLLAKAAGTGYAVTGSADQFDSMFETLHPRGPGGQFAAKPATTPTAKLPIATKSLEKIGPQLGSNPGGQYQDTSGQKFYVKQTQSEDHARNENLAASLYALAGAGTLPYRRAEDDPKAVVTEMIPLGINNVSGLSPLQRKAAQEDFAAHAWLANWDAVGLSGDNIGVAATGPGRPINLDLGGSLKYRAKGGLKPSFGSDVTEWNTLRDTYKNPQAASLFKDMTPGELQASASQVAGVTQAQIRAAVKGAGYEGQEAQDLADILISRRQDVLNRAQAEVAKPAAPPPPPPFAAPFTMPDYSSATMSQLNSAAPQGTAAQRGAVKSYTGGGYGPINKSLRYGYHAGGDEKIEAITKWLDQASLPEETVVSRRVHSDYASFLTGVASHPGAVFTDLGFASTSIDPNAWSGEVQMIVRLPKGTKAAAVQALSQHPGEREVLVQRGSRYRVTGYDKKASRIYCEVDQSHLVKTENL